MICFLDDQSTDVKDEDEAECSVDLSKLQDISNEYPELMKVGTSVISDQGEIVSL